MIALLRKIRDYTRWSRWHLGRIRLLEDTLARVLNELDDLRFLIGSAAVRNSRITNDDFDLHNHEIKIHSQFGEDGIVQCLVNRLNLRNERFVEFGVEDYLESNTRFLLRHDNWKGLVFDSSEENIRRIQNSKLYWSNDLTAICSFITAENINELLTESGFCGDIGLLSIDVDGNDYHIWNAIQVIRPTIVICEYNSVFGLNPVTIPYTPDFQRTEAHTSNLYFGASITALCHLASQKGYAFVGSNSSGSNAFFVKADEIQNIPSLQPTQGYVESRFRESKDETGRLTYLAGHSRAKAIEGLPVLNVITGEIQPFLAYPHIA